VEPNAGHACDKVSVVIAPYLRSIIARKSANIYANLRTIQPDLIASNQTLDLLSNRNHNLSVGKTSSMPDLSFYQVWRDFQEGKAINSPPISFASKMESFNNLASISDIELSTYVQKSSTASIQIQVSTLPINSEKCQIEFVDPEGVWRERLLRETSAWNTYQIDFTPGNNMPLGVYRGVLKVRYLFNGQELPVTLNIPAYVKVEGDAHISPASIYLGSIKRSDQEEKQIKIWSTGGYKTKVLSVHLPQDIQIPYHIEALQDGSAVLNLSLSGRNLVNRTPFNLIITVQTDCIWNLCIPIIWCSSQEAEQSKNPEQLRKVQHISDGQLHSAARQVLSFDCEPTG
jgi:hypothetical protein